LPIFFNCVFGRFSIRGTQKRDKKNHVIVRVQKFNPGQQRQRGKAMGERAKKKHAHLHVQSPSQKQPPNSDLVFFPRPVFLVALLGFKNTKKTFLGKKHVENVLQTK
jgi:hypothetical protein